MSHKSKGISAERDLVARFWKTGKWVAHRIAGSGSSKYPSPDVLAGNKKRKLAIECKVTKDKAKYLTKEEVEQLKLFAKLFDVEPWIAVRFAKLGWFFIALENLEETEHSFVVTADLARAKGVFFEELIKS